jgi:hypothetical protein
VDSGVTPHVIDSHVMYSRKLFDTAYYLNAKEFGYNAHRYFNSFFLVDLIFPVAYTLLFLSTAALLSRSVYYRHLKVLFLTGGLLDYLENFSFALFLNSSDDSLAAPVAVFSTLKSLSFGVNMIVVLFILFYSLPVRRNT